MRIFYVTDLEGNVNYFRRFLEMSGLAFDPETLVPDLPNESYFVFGGDVFDRGIGDLKIGRALVALKKKYPDRVYLLIGNRDVNKMKLTSELSDKDLSLGADAISYPYWLEPGDAPTYKEFLVTKIKKDGHHETPTRELIEQHNTRANKLKWILQYTMGAGRAFEYRREELALERGVENSQVSDDEVALSFYESAANPDGVVRQYLEHAQIGVVLGNTLFVHGAVSEKSLNFIPRDDMTETRNRPEDVTGQELQASHTVQEWIDLLNAWGAKKIKEWIENPEFSDDRRSRGGEALLAYSFNISMCGRTVIVTNFSPTGNPCPISDLAVKILKRSGISRVLSGHKPFGDSPTFFRSSGIIFDHMNPNTTHFVDNDIEIVTADQSYSDTSASDTRGRAVAVVKIEGEKDCNRVVCEALLKEGERVRFATQWRSPLGVVSSKSSTEFLDTVAGLKRKYSSELADDDMIGLHTIQLPTITDSQPDIPTESSSSGRKGVQKESTPYSHVFWVKARFDNGDYYLTRGHGYKVEYLRVPGDILRQNLGNPNYNWSQHYYRD